MECESSHYPSTVSFSHLSSLAIDLMTKAQVDYITHDYVSAVELSHRIYHDVKLVDSLISLHNQTTALVAHIVSLSNAAKALETGFGKLKSFIFTSDIKKVHDFIANLSAAYSNGQQQTRKLAAEYLLQVFGNMRDLTNEMHKAPIAFKTMHEAQWFYSSVSKLLDKAILSIEIATTYLSQAVSEEAFNKFEYSPDSFYKSKSAATFCQDWYFRMFHFLDRISPMLSYASLRVSLWLRENSQDIIYSLAKSFQSMSTDSIENSQIKRLKQGNNYTADNPSQNFTSGSNQTYNINNYTSTTNLVENRSSTKSNRLMKPISNINDSENYVTSYILGFWDLMECYDCNFSLDLLKHFKSNWTSLAKKITESASDSTSYCLLQYEHTLEKAYKSVNFSLPDAPIWSLEIALSKFISEILQAVNMLNSITHSYLIGETHLQDTINLIKLNFKGVSNNVMNAKQKITLSAVSWRDDIILWQAKVNLTYFSIINNLASLLSFLSDNSRHLAPAKSLLIWHLNKVLLDVIHYNDIPLLYHLSFFEVFQHNFTHFLQFNATSVLQDILIKSINESLAYSIQSQETIEALCNDWFTQINDANKLINDYESDLVIDEAFLR